MMRASAAPAERGARGKKIGAVAVTLRSELRPVGARQELAAQDDLADQLGVVSLAARLLGEAPAGGPSSVLNHHRPPRHVVAIEHRQLRASTGEPLVHHPRGVLGDDLLSERLVSRVFVNTLVPPSNPNFVPVWDVVVVAHRPCPTADLTCRS
jgi:hypothetical protein